MKLNFEISRLALKDLDNIWEYTVKQWSKEQANKYYNEIFSVTNKICQNSDIGQPIDEIKKGHQRTNVKYHIIIYKVKGTKVYIDRILHQKMDIEKHLNE
ncbi:MAG TPA: type II toxin-antitoxin system RelE/ParE family toxin [Saprospiraceae bacterium]|nr:type II toxin-antitoxin system RelE/ParE family toxin [Saprospiraceae bacterium]HNE63574.1 type II toxin-antitoxin system RelE/ParE family toxin [Saprospiraceae bacterium]HNO71968.1 type II toxin-antitoxin system RelE/ParE family toxin [Bacteroidia bacterium]